MPEQEWFVQSAFAHIAEPLLEYSACFMLLRYIFVQNHFVTVKGKLFALQIFLNQRLGLNLEIQVWVLQPSTENQNVFSLGVHVLLLGAYTLV